MTFEELINQLKTLEPYLVVQLWDTRDQRFNDKFTLTPTTFDDELLVVPSSPARPRLPEKSWKQLI